MTAIIDGPETDAGKRRAVQDFIMGRHCEVEQVGFFGVGADGPALIMTGGEFCGNAARSAAWHYLGGRPGETALHVSGASRPIRAGVCVPAGVVHRSTAGSECSAAPVAWAEMPLGGGCIAKNVGKGMFWVEMEGISHLVLEPDASVEHLAGLTCETSSYPLLLHDKRKPSQWYAGADLLLRRAEYVIKRCAIHTDIAYGVIFTEIVGSDMKIHPCVFVKTAAAAFYETACGSGSAAVAIALGARLSGRSGGSGSGAQLSLLQPSGKYIEASVDYDGARAIRAAISGPVEEVPLTL